MGEWGGGGIVCLSFKNTSFDFVLWKTNAEYPQFWKDSRSEFLPFVCEKSIRCSSLDMLLNTFTTESFCLSLNNLKNICRHLHGINSNHCSVVFLMDVEYYALPVRSLSYLLILILFLSLFRKIKHFFQPRKNPGGISISKVNFPRMTYLYHNDLIYNDITLFIVPFVCITSFCSMNSSCYIVSSKLICS